MTTPDGDNGSFGGFRLRTGSFQFLEILLHDQAVLNATESSQERPLRSVDPFGLLQGLESGFVQFLQGCTASFN